jgi:hypothetical protein
MNGYVGRRMSEGLIYKKIHEEIGVSIFVEDAVKQILDEAKQEYESLVVRWLEEYPGDGGDILAIWRGDWFLKWFGEVKKDE